MSRFFVLWQSDYFELRYSKCHIWLCEFKVKVMMQKARSWSRSIPFVTYEAQGSIDMFAFCFVAIGPFSAEPQQIPFLTLKILGRDHGQGQTWWSRLRARVQSICLFAFRGNRTIFVWFTGNSIFGLKNATTSLRRKLTKILSGNP